MFFILGQYTVTIVHLSRDAENSEGRGAWEGFLVTTTEKAKTESCPYDTKYDMLRIVQRGLIYFPL